MRRFAFALALSALSLAAQTSSLQGLITDAQGGAVPAAVVTATNTSTSAGRKALSDETGAYSFLQLPPGAYNIIVEKPGFRAQSTSITLQTNTPTSWNVKMEVGQVSESVSVSAQAASVNTENAAVGNPFTETQIKNIPLQTRNIVDLLRLQPGVSSSGQVAGAKSDQNNVMLDGVDVNDVNGNDGFDAVLPIPLDSVQEFKTTIAGVGADQGRSSGGQVSIITKGGSNGFHGSVYEYNRNTATSANGYFPNKANVPRAALVRNQYGFSLGGPMIKNRLFFFYNFEGRTDRSAASRTATVPSDTFKQGILKVAVSGNRTVDLDANAIKAIDPLHIGINPYITDLMKQYPSGNNPTVVADRGLNFNQLLFNAPNKLDNHAQVGRMDFNIDPAGKHTLMARGTLNGAANDGTLAQFPGQAAAQRQLDNSRGLAVKYTAVIAPTMVNVLSYGYTRLSTSQTGNNTVIPTFGFTAFQATPRGSSRFSPVTNINDDLTWTKNRHTIQMGFSFRFTENNSNSAGSFPSYSFSRNTLAGLGNDISNAATAYIQSLPGFAGATLSSSTNVTNAFGAAFGMLNQYSGTFRFGIDGKAIPFGTAYGTAFVNQEYEGYVQDAFKIKRNLTITAGLRYSLYGVPYEKNGVQVVPTVPLSQYFAERVGAQAIGIPNSILPTSYITYKIGGKANGGQGYYPVDKNNFAPRLSIAWSPDSGSMLESIFGKGSVWRAGGGVIYDHYGNAMAQAFSSGGSPGLASSVAQTVNTDFSTAPRFNGSNLPALVAPAGGQFPYTPPQIVGGFTTFRGIQSDLIAPYEYTFSLNYARPIAKGVTIELGYIGRMSHSGISEQDFGQPLTLFKDPKSGQTLKEASAFLSNAYNSGLTGAQVRANPALLPTQPFFENMFGASRNYKFTGSPTSQFFYQWYSGFSGSFLDALNDFDRTRQTTAGGGCFSVFGCNTFFSTQNSGLRAFANVGNSSYNAATVVVRRVVSKGWGFDFNYTWSHGLDNGSGSETSGGSALQDAFNPAAFRGPANFDARHQLTFNWVLEVPLGKGKFLWGSMPRALDYVIGGWQISGLGTFRTGTPLTVTVGGIYNTNYLNGSYAVLKPGASLPASGLTVDNTGTVSIFPNATAVTAFQASDAGTVGSRGILRGVNSFNVDMGVQKYIKIHERWNFMLRAEAFNALNRVNFGGPSLSLANPTIFGQITSAGAARVMQFAGRLEF